MARPTPLESIPAIYIPAITGDTISVRAGSEGKVFHVHKNVLAASPFAKNAMKKIWMEAKEPEQRETWLDLTPHSPEVVEKYIQWLYSHNLSISVTATELVDLYVFGDEMMHDEFVNAVLDKLIRMNNHSRCPFTIDLIHAVYRKTRSGSSLRRLAVDSLAWYGSTEPGMIDSLQEDFIKDLLRASMKQRKENPRLVPWLYCPTQYHHGVDPDKAPKRVTFSDQWNLSRFLCEDWLDLQYLV